MLPIPAEQSFVTADEYLVAEASRVYKHEYVNGEVFAMASASDAHVTVGGNIFAALKAHLRGSECRVFIADMKLRIDASNAYFYPDVFVSCGEAAQQGTAVKYDALLVVEVLSPTTAAFDRGAKFAHYRQLPGLHEYMVVDIETRSVDLYRKGSDGFWVLHPYADNDTAELASVGLELPLATVVFEDVAAAV